MKSRRYKKIINLIKIMKYMYRLELKKKKERSLITEKTEERREVR